MMFWSKNDNESQYTKINGLVECDTNILYSFNATKKSDDDNYDDYEKKFGNNKEGKQMEYAYPVNNKEFEEISKNDNNLYMINYIFVYFFSSHSFYKHGWFQKNPNTI